MPNYNWPKKSERKVIGTRVTRLDGIQKASGKAKYNSDVRPAGTIHAAILHSPYAHARIRTIDTSEAEKMPGVRAVRVAAPAGTEIRFYQADIAYVAADREEIARDAVRKIKVDYEVLPHLVREEDLGKAGANARPSGETLTGDPEAAFKQADAIVEETYGIPVLTHCCLEPHGQNVAFDGAKVEYLPSTQSVSAIGGQLAQMLQVPATAIHTHQDHIGGGFGSKFGPDAWGAHAAQLSKSAGGKPVKLFLDRRPELQIAGVRPSVWGKIKVGAKKDGTVIAWDSLTWSTGGVGAGNVAANVMPYVFQRIANKRVNHTAVTTNNGAQRAWRAPTHPQVSYVTCSALDDLAAKLNMNPLEFFKKNAEFAAAPRVDMYRKQLDKCAEMIGWNKLWHPRGDKTAGNIKRGLGIGIGTWQGAGHPSQCRTNIHPDGSVEIEICTQDLGTGTRTVLAMVAAESFGLPISSINVKIGDNSYPTSGNSGGSTTVGGVSSSTRMSTLAALEKLLTEVAPGLGVPVDQLEAIDGKIQVKGNAAKSMTWKQACQKLGVKTITEVGDYNGQRVPGMSTAGVGGIQMADVSVDIETGIVKMNKVVGSHDIGLVINPKTAESQVFGGIIMNICGALMEERVMDEITGTCLNADMEFYKLAGIMDVGEIEVHFDNSDENEARGVIGLGEPSNCPTLGAIANAVANAIGVRVPVLPLTPRHVLNALNGRRTA